MRFLILGGTGPSGILLIRKTLQLYPDTATIVVYARSPNKLPDDLTNHPAVSIIKGTLEDLDTAETAVQGADVVLSALGPVLTGHPPNNPIATFYGHLIALMRKYGVKRLIVLGTASISDAHDRSSWTFAALVAGVKTLARTAYNDIVAIGEVVRGAEGEGEGLEWTIVRVPFLTNADSEGVVAGYVGDGKTGVFLSRKAYAAFVLGEVERREWVRKVPLISNA